MASAARLPVLPQLLKLVLGVATLVAVGGERSGTGLAVGAAGKLIKQGSLTAPVAAADTLPAREAVTPAALPPAAPAVAPLPPAPAAVATAPAPAAAAGSTPSDATPTGGAFTAVPAAAAPTVEDTSTPLAGTPTTQASASKAKASSAVSAAPTPPEATQVSAQPSGEGMQPGAQTSAGAPNPAAVLPSTAAARPTPSTAATASASAATSDGSAGAVPAGTASHGANKNLISSADKKAWESEENGAANREVQIHKFMGDTISEVDNAVKALQDRQTGMTKRFDSAKENIDVYQKAIATKAKMFGQLEYKVHDLPLEAIAKANLNEADRNEPLDELRQEAEREFKVHAHYKEFVDNLLASPEEFQRNLKVAHVAHFEEQERAAEEARKKKEEEASSEETSTEELDRFAHEAGFSEEERAAEGAQKKEEEEASSEETSTEELDRFAHEAGFSEEATAPPRHGD